MYEANDFKVTQTKKPIFRLAFDLVAGTGLEPVAFGL